MVFSTAAQNLIQRLMAEARWPDITSPQCDWVHAHAKRLAALPVGLDLWSWWFLTPDGEAILVEDGYDIEYKRHRDRGKVVAALVWGSEKYTELSEVFPAREPESVDCHCYEIQRQARKRFLCHECGGLGWLPAEARPPT